MNNMPFSHSTTFALRIVHEMHNARLNRETIGLLLKSIDPDEHPTDTLQACKASVWILGRCFCDKPLVRVFDCFGRVDIVPLKCIGRTLA